MFSKSNPVSIKGLFFKSCSGNERTKGEKKGAQRESGGHPFFMKTPQMKIQEIIRAAPGIYKYAEKDNGTPTGFNCSWGNVNPHNIPHVYEQLKKCIKKNAKGVIGSFDIGKKKEQFQKEVISSMHRIPLSVEKTIPVMTGHKIPASGERRLSSMSTIPKIPALSSTKHKQPIMLPTQTISSVPVEQRVPIMMRPYVPVEARDNPVMYTMHSGQTSAGRKPTLVLDQHTPAATLRKQDVQLKKPKGLCPFLEPPLQIPKEEVMPSLQKPKLQNIEGDETGEGDEDEEEEEVASMEEETEGMTKKLLADMEFKRRSEMSLPKYVTKVIKKNKTNFNCINVKLPDEKTKFASKIWPLNIPFVYPIYKDRKVPVVLSKTVNTVYQEGDEVTEVPCVKYKPYLVPVEVYVPKIVGTYLKNKKVDCKVNEQTMKNDLKAKLMKKLNPHLDSLHKYNCEQQKYLEEIYNFSNAMVQKRNLKLPPIRRLYKNTPKFEVFYRRIKLVDKQRAD